MAEAAKTWHPGGMFRTCAIVLTGLLAAAGTLGLGLGRSATRVPVEALSPRPDARTRTALTTDAAGAYDVELFAPRDCRTDSPCEVTFRIVPREGWHANRWFPFAFKTLSGARFDVAFEEEGAARVRVFSVPTTPGDHHVKGRLQVSTCAPELCRIGFHDIDLVLPTS